jgi:DNA-binding MarR family transcriptional regulator
MQGNLADMTPARDDDRTSLEVMDNLVLAAFTVIAHLSRIAADNEMSLTQLRMLAILRDRQPTMAELAGFLGLERSSVTGLIDRAVARGLVRRDNSAKDGRTVLVVLTAAGQRLAEQLSQRAQDLILPMIGNLNPADRKRLGTLLAKSLA